MKNLMMEINFWMAETNSTRDYFTSQIGFVRDKIKLAQDSFKREIEYMSAKLDTKRTDIKIMKDRNHTKFDSMSDTMSAMSATIIWLSQDINEVLKNLELTKK